MLLNVCEFHYNGVLSLVFSQVLAVRQLRETASAKLLGLNKNKNMQCLSFLKT